MAIRSGGGKRSNKPENATFVPPGRLRPKKPLLPVGDPFPSYQGFALGHYRVVEEHDDYVVCNGYDPNAKDPFAEITPDAFRTIKVAKPPILQRSRWDGQTVTIDGVDYTYTYSDTEFGVRTASSTDGDVEERIYFPYEVGDLLVAVEIKKNAAVRGMEVTDEDGVRLRWIDLNVSGRQWKGAGTVATIIRFTISSATGSDATVSVDAVSQGSHEDNTSVTASDVLGCLLNESASALVGRKGYAVKMHGGAYEIISLCCPP